VAGLFLLMLWAGNLVLFGFNMLPAFPMDGGRVLRALLSLWVGRLRATEIASWVGIGVALLLGTVVAYQFDNPLLALVAAFVIFAGRVELMSLRRLEAERRAAAAVPVEVIRPILPWAEPAPEQPRDPAPRGFTGLAWDREARVWVLWHDGRPVQVLG
jgi:hypothetical protein